MIYTKDQLFKFAQIARENQGTLEDAFLEWDKPLTIPEEILLAACEMCNVSIKEIKPGSKYGEIPTAKISL